MGVQVLRWKWLILLHDKKGPENRKHEVKLRPPLCSPLRRSMIDTKDRLKLGKETQKRRSDPFFMHVQLEHSAPRIAIANR